MRGLVLAIVAGLALSGCAIVRGVESGVSAVTSPFTGVGSRRGVADFDGLRFRTRVTVTSEDRRSFTTSTSAAERNPLLANEAGRTQAITYCLRTFGGSQIQWTNGPNVEPEAITIEPDGVLLLSGRCVAR